MTSVKTVNITKNQREGRRTSLGKASGEETNPILLSTILRDYRNPLVSTLGAQQRPGVLTKGRGTPSSGSGGGGVTLESVEGCPQVQGLGIVWVSPHPHGSGSCVHRDHTSALYLQCVLSPQIPSIWIEAVSLVNLWSFSFSSPCRLHMRSGGLLLCFAEWKPLVVSY